MPNTNHMIAKAWTGREQARFESTASTAYTRLVAGEGVKEATRLPTSLLLNI